MQWSVILWQRKSETKLLQNEFMKERQWSDKYDYVDVALKNCSSQAYQKDDQLTSLLYLCFCKGISVSV